MSTLFLRTLRDDPADAEVPSHKLLVRAGYVRRAAPGGFTWLPLGWIVYRNVERVVRDEMDRAGFQEVHFPALLPREPYELSGRWTDYGENLFRLQDRRGNDFLLAPTHEELFTLLVKDLYSSYKDLPLVIYQIQTKFRDEARPRAGLLRGREFVMKDSYSFDVDDDGLAVSYQRHRDAYIATFERLGLPFVIVSAMSGAMGGSASEEFLAPIDVGEDTFVRCSTGDYAANVEAVQVPVPPPVPLDGLPPAVVHDTPETPTIATLVDLLNARDDLRRDDRLWAAADTLKNVLVMLRQPDGTTEPLAVGVPGDREVDMKRLEAAVLPGRAGAVRRRRLRRPPGAGQGLRRTRGARRGFDHGHPLPRRPAGRDRHPLGDGGRRAPAATSSTWSPVATSRPTGSSTSPTSAPAIRAPRAGRRSRSPAASRSATSSSSAASTPRRSGSRCSGPTASR